MRRASWRQNERGRRKGGFGNVRRGPTKAPKKERLHDAKNEREIVNGAEEEGVKKQMLRASAAKEEERREVENDFLLSPLRVVTF